MFECNVTYFCLRNIKPHSIVKVTFESNLKSDWIWICFGTLNPSSTGIPMAITAAEDYKFYQHHIVVCVCVRGDIIV